MNAANTAKSRGTILRAPDTTPGILFVNGQQHNFTLERVWKSPVAPAANQAVDVEFDAAGHIASITVVDSQLINKEKLAQFSGVAQERGKEAAKLAQKGIGALAARMGAIPLGAAVVVLIAWFFLTAVSVPGATFTYWDFLGIDFAHGLGLGGSSHGIFALIGILAIAAPFAAPFIPHPLAKYLNASPLAFVLLAYLVFRWDISSAFKDAGDFGKMAKRELLDSISFSYGYYILLIASLVLAAFALKSKPVAAASH